MGLKKIYSREYLIFPTFPFPSMGIDKSKMQSFSINPVKCDRQKFTFFTLKLGCGSIFVTTKCRTADISGLEY